MKQAELHWQENQPINTQFNDIYFSREGGMAETESVFLHQNDLPERWQRKSRFVIAETGFGTGLNFLTTGRHWLQTCHKTASLHYFSVEKYPLNSADLKRALSCWPVLDDLLTELLRNYPPAVGGFHHIPLFNHRVMLTLMLGNVETMLAQMNARVDAWYLDGFAPDKNPEMWTNTVFQKIKRLSQKGTTFSIFTPVSRIRRALTALGFEVKKVKGFAQKWETCRGKLSKDPEPLHGKPWFEVGKSNHQKKHAIVVGAGIAGVTTAWALAQRGWRIDLIEQHGGIAQEGSGMPLGILLPRISLKESAESAFYAVAYFKAIRVLTQLKKEDSGFSWQQGGVLQLATRNRILKQIEKLDCSDDFVKAVSDKEASKIAGVPLHCSALYFPLAGWLNPGDLCARLIEDSSGRIKVHFKTAIHRLSTHDGHWQLFDQKDQLKFESEIVVLANAAHVMQFQQTKSLPLTPARGQISLQPATEKSKRIRCAICCESYVLPETDGTHVIGATFTRGDQGTELREADHAENRRKLEGWLPGIFDDPEIFDDNKTKLKGRAAVRAISPDRMPLVGPVPDVDSFMTQDPDRHKGKTASNNPRAKYSQGSSLPGLYVNVGHGAKGLCSSFLSAELLASQINDEPLPISKTVQQALHPARFMIRNLKKQKKNL